MHCVKEERLEQDGVSIRSLYLEQDSLLPPLPSYKRTHSLKEVVFFLKKVKGYILFGKPLYKVISKAADPGSMSGKSGTMYPCNGVASCSRSFPDRREDVHSMAVTGEQN